MVEKTLGQIFYEMVAAVYQELIGVGGPPWEEMDPAQQSQFETTAQAKAIEFFGLALEDLRRGGKNKIVELIQRGIKQGAPWNF